MFYSCLIIFFPYFRSLSQMGNYNMEPPGLFRGRGEHPRTGALKKVCLCVCVCLS